jgi:hypothetical protein
VKPPDVQIVDVIQGSPEWLAARCGVLTGTCAAGMLAKIKSGEAAGRRNLRAQLVVERLTGQPQEDNYVSADMLRGSLLEPDGVAAYEALTGNAVARVGFLRRTDMPVGFSPDGIIGDFDGLLELKCPRSCTHLAYLEAGVLPPEYAPQVTHGLYVSGAAFCDFCSFDPRFPEHLQLFRVRVEISEFDLMVYERTVRAFLDEVDQKYKAMRSRGPLQPPTANEPVGVF